jgi:1-deoxy-D-xylulose 5-phosphate reductoisomerase
MISGPAMGMKWAPLSFADVDGERFPCLDLAYEAGKKGGTYPAALSAADEAAVELEAATEIDPNYAAAWANLAW